VDAKCGGEGDCTDDLGCIEHTGTGECVLEDCALFDEINCETNGIFSCEWDHSSLYCKTYVDATCVFISDVDTCNSESGCVFVDGFIFNLVLFT
jgi:hypothetical protein